MSKDLLNPRTEVKNHKHTNTTSARSKFVVETFGRRLVGNILRVSKVRVKAGPLGQDTRRRRLEIRSATEAISKFVLPRETRAGEGPEVFEKPVGGEPGYLL